MQSDPLLVLLHRLNANINAVGSAVEVLGHWVDQRGSTEVSEEVARQLDVLLNNSDAVSQAFAELLALRLSGS